MMLTRVSDACEGSPLKCTAGFLSCLLLPAGQVHTPHFLLVLAGIKPSVCSL